MQDKVIAVTGACGSLGRAVVAELASRRAIPIAIDISGGPAPASAAHAVLGIDVADLDAAQRAVEAIILDAGRLDGLVNIAGGFTWQKVADGPLSEWDRLYRMNFSTALSMSRAALPHLVAARGTIVNIGAASAIKAAAGMSAYAASKSAIARLTESLAEETKDMRVRVNAVLPSIIDTPANRKEMPDAEFDRWVTPAALAKAILFLLSDDAEAVTGALLPVTGRV
jgi:NAD(P)-dependent dehydrogenase (short-subunit alcohol dehydrogenase family)